MEGTGGSSTEPNAAEPLRSSDLSGWLRVQIFAPTMTVAILAFFATGWFAVHPLGIPPRSVPIDATMSAIFVPVMLLFARYINPLRDPPFTRCCFLLECLAILAATTASNIAAIAVLHPWLGEEHGVLTRLGLATSIVVPVSLAASAAHGVALRACANRRDLARPEDG